MKKSKKISVVIMLLAVMLVFAAVFPAAVSATAPEAAAVLFCILVSVFTLSLAALNIISVVLKPKQAMKLLFIAETLCSIFVITGVVYWSFF